MKNEIKKYFNEFKIGTKKMFKEFFKKETNKSQRANMWTFTRLITPFITLIISVIGIITNSLSLFVISGIIAGMGAATDYFDGKSSRKHKSSSEYGKLLDQVSDKIFAGIIGINLLFVNINYFITLLGETIISLINVGYKLKYKNMNINSTKIGRIKEWPLFLTLALGYLSPISNTWMIVSNIAILMTFIIQLMSAKSYIIQNENEVKKIINEKQNKINLEETDNKEKEKTLVLTKNKDLKEKNNSQTLSKQDQIKELQNIKDELTTTEEKINNNQKVLK